MYLEYFGLRDKPFGMGADLSRYYPAAHQEAQNELLYSIEERQGLAIFVGEPGTGKTTLLKNVQRLLGTDVRGVLVSDVSLSGESLLEQVLRELAPRAQDDPSPHILRSVLEESFSQGRAVVLMVDEAQALADDQLEELQYLSNLELGNHKLVQLIAAGQPSFERKLEEPRFEALRQRVAVRTCLKPLSLKHTQAYVELRLQASGARTSKLFRPESIRLLHELSRGIPRLINLIADRALLIGYAEERDVVDETAVRQAASELQLSENAGAESSQRQATNPVATRLDAIEQKLDQLIAGLRRAGMLPETEDSEASGRPQLERPPVSNSAEERGTKRPERDRNVETFPVRPTGL